MSLENKIKAILLNLGLSDSSSIVPFYPRVRDRDDVSVLKCEKSGVIFLSSLHHINRSHYDNKNDLSYWGEIDRQKAVLLGLEDTERRFHRLKHLVCNKRWLDIGTGVGGILDKLSPLAAETVAVEPQIGARDCLRKLGYTVYPSVDELPSSHFDVVTLFHVFEHLDDPIGILNLIREKMVMGGQLIIEVPNARDFLLAFLNIEEFKAFTLWSEHLILHTRESLSAFLKAAHFGQSSIEGCQRYPLANHLHWLSKKRPGGHLTWSQCRTEELDRSYANMLATLDYTDTLISVSQRTA